MTDLEQYNDSAINRLRSAESFLIPKGEDMQACINGLAAVCGIEAPPYVNDRDERKSQGITFRYAKGIDIPDWVAEGWADVGVTGTDSIAESPRKDKLVSLAIGKPMCKYSLLVVEQECDRFAYDLMNGSFDGRRSSRLEVPATRPSLLEETRGLLAVRPMAMAIRGSGELAIRLSKWKAGADLVKTGKSAREAGLIEYAKLTDVYAALVTRR